MVIARMLARMLPREFRDRQRAEWTADLLDLPRADRARYLLAAAWTLPELRAVVRAGRPAWWSFRGLRAGLGRPGTSGIVALAVLMAVLGGLAGAATATRAGWEFTRPLPTGAEAAELKRTVFPGAVVTEETGWAPWGGSVYGRAHYSVDGPPIPGTGARLTAAGWHRVPEMYDSTDLRWERGELVLTYSTLDSYATVSNAVPKWMGWAALAGAVAGALLGWLLTGWAGRRAREGSIAGQLAALIIWPTAAVVLLMTSLGFLIPEYGMTSREAFFMQLLYLSESAWRWALPVAAVAFGVAMADPAINRLMTGELNRRRI